MAERKPPTPHAIVQNLIEAKRVLDVPSIEIVGNRKEIEKREEMRGRFNHSVDQAQTLNYDVGKLLKDAERALYPEGEPEKA